MSLGDIGKSSLIDINLPAGSIQGGVEHPLPAYTEWTLCLKAGAAADVTVELSPDGGTTWYEVDESAVTFGSAGDKVLSMSYQANRIKLTGNNTADITAQVRGVF